MNWTHVSYAQQLRFACGAVEDAGRIAGELGARRILLITTARGRQSVGGRRLVQSLGAALASVFDSARAHVPEKQRHAGSSPDLRWPVESAIPRLPVEHEPRQWCEPSSGLSSR